MKNRCLNRNVKAYKHYGGRGIKVYPPWLTDFAMFLRHVGARPSAKHTLERKKVHLGYVPGNVVWATWKAQQNNRSNNVRVRYRGRAVTLAQLSDMSGVPYSTLQRRLRKRHMPVTAAVAPYDLRNGRPLWGKHGTAAELPSQAPSTAGSE
jgi:hypothetical protein